MPHFDEDDRDEVFEKDSKESKEFKENGEEMDVDVDDEQVNIFMFKKLTDVLFIPFFVFGFWSLLGTKL